MVMQLPAFTKRLFAREKTPEASQRFWDLARQHEKFLYNLALKYTGNRYDAEDLMQETLYLALKNFHQLREENKFKSWLFTIFRNHYLRTQRKMQKRKTIEFEDQNAYVDELGKASTAFDIAAAYEQKAEADALHEQISRLPEKYKAVVVLYYLDEHTYQQIADLLEIPVGTVMSRLARAKQQLKKALLIRSAPLKAPAKLRFSPTVR